MELSLGLFIDYFYGHMLATFPIIASKYFSKRTLADTMLQDILLSQLFPFVKSIAY